MVFSSPTFLFLFLPFFLATYFVLPTTKLRNYVLAGYSMVFYAWGDARHTPLVVSLILINYSMAIAIGAWESHRRSLLALGISINVGALVISKYTGFLVGNFRPVALLFGYSIRDPGIVMPLGISFLSFHSISYLVDVFRGKARANRRFDEILVYMAMFPQLIAGPIVRYSTVADRIGLRRTTLGRISAGMWIFVIGLAWKVLIADEVARIAIAVFDETAAPTWQDACIGLLAYAIQIYFDFAGYSNMAIGLAVALGLNFPRNFRMPYTAGSVGDFWRRWHISLSAWFRDYVYIPLGGNRSSSARTAANLWVVFILCGLWHGAEWTFLIWGLHHGLFLVIERGRLGTWLAASPRAVGRSYTLLVVLTGWVWFRAHDVAHAIRVFRGLAGLNGTGGLSEAVHIVLHPLSITALVVGWLLALCPTPALLRAGRRRWSRLFGWAEVLVLGTVLVFALLSVAAGTFSPFLYFRF